MEQLNVTLGNAPGEDVILRTGQALPLAHKVGYRFTGQLKSPVEYLKNKQPDFATTVVEISEEEVKLIAGYNLPADQQDTVIGQIKKSRYAKELFGGLTQPLPLGEYLRKNRLLFTDATQGAKTVSALKGFTAKVNTQISKLEDKGAASWEDVLTRNIDSDLPSSIALRIPLLEEESIYTAKVFECDLFVTQKNREIYVELESLDFEEAVTAHLESLMQEIKAEIPAGYLVLIK